MIGNTNIEKNRNSYGCKKWSAFTTSGSSSQTIEITTSGRPVFICLCGDNNPSSSTAWCRASIYRNSTKLTEEICESRNQSNNVVFNVCYLDIISAGTYTYQGLIEVGSGSITFGEEGNVQAPQFMAFEI